MSFHHKLDKNQKFANPIYGRLPVEIQLDILNYITPKNSAFYTSPCEPCPYRDWYLSINTISCNSIPNIEYVLHREVYKPTTTIYPICITPWNPKNLQVAPIRYGYALANVWTDIGGNDVRRIYTNKRKRFAIFKSHQEARRLLSENIWLSSDPATTRNPAVESHKRLSPAPYNIITL